MPEPDDSAYHDLLERVAKTVSEAHRLERERGFILETMMNTAAHRRIVAEDFGRWLQAAELHAIGAGLKQPELDKVEAAFPAGGRGQPMNMEERHLAEADRHIADAERRISEQERRLERMGAAGEDTCEGERLLALFRETLIELEIHRRLILDDLARL